ncbi:hypothetical protein EAF04_004310 [Stromatinia cepivora]|nr:hypothetical protein EAF04_004310 [Stromatinia cepivora]
MFLEITVFVLTTWMTASIFNIFQSKTDLPRVGTNPKAGLFIIQTWWARWKWYKHEHADVIRAYEQSKNTNYVIQKLMGDTIVLAPKFLNELNTLPESKLSSTAALVDSGVMGQYNGVDLLLRDHLTSDICRGPFTRNLGVDIHSGMAEELHVAIAEHLSESTAGKPITCIGYEILFSFIHRISSQVFVGKTFAHNPIWTSAVTNLPVDVEITKFLLLPFPAVLRRFVAPLIPQRNRIFQQRKEVRKLLFPKEGLVGRTRKVNEVNEPSVMKLFLESGKDTDPDSITARLLLLTAAVLHTSSTALTHVISDLCAMPEYIEPLRFEAQTALAQDNGEWRFSTIKKLRRLDSFPKESQRVNQSTFLGFDRKVKSPVKIIRW